MGQRFTAVSPLRAHFPVRALVANLCLDAYGDNEQQNQLFVAPNLAQEGEVIAKMGFLKFL